MCESVMTEYIRREGLEYMIEVSSAATSREEIGNTPHYGTVSKLRQEGIPLVPHRARQMTPADYEEYDLLIGMDTANIRNMHRILGSDPQGKVRKLLDRDVADPWYTGDFEATYRDVCEGCKKLLEEIKNNEY